MISFSIDPPAVTVPLNFFPTASSQLSDIYGSSGKQVGHIVKHWCSLLVLQCPHRLFSSGAAKGTVLSVVLWQVVSTS
jgi:hypothetical protein